MEYCLSFEKEIKNPPRRYDTQTIKQHLKSIMARRQANPICRMLFKFASMAIICFCLLSSFQGVAAAPICRSVDAVTTTNAASGYKNVGYYVDWRVDRYRPQDMPVDKLTHVLYSFAVPNDNGTLHFTNDYADFNKALGPGENAPGNEQKPDELRGALEQMYVLKKSNRNMKSLLSIGGFTHSIQFPKFALDPAGRKHFVDSAISMMKDFGMDGIDIDWEYPSNSAEGTAFTALLRELRAEMDAYSARSAAGYHFEITAAVGGGWSALSNLDFAGMDSVLDAWHLMSYDFKGGFWSHTSGHHANLRMSSPAVTDISVEGMVDTYLSHNIPSNKLVLGFPLYGQAFLNTEGLGAPSSGGSGEGYEYKGLPHPGAQEFYDAESGAAYSYDAAKKELVSYDTPQTARAKAEYLKNKGLGGSMWWELSNDKAGEGSLVNAVSDTLGGMEWKENQLCYPESKYRNIREGGC